MNNGQNFNHWLNIDYIKELLLFVMWNNDAIIMLFKKSFRDICWNICGLNNMIFEICFEIMWKGEVDGCMGELRFNQWLILVEADSWVY